MSVKRSSSSDYIYPLKKRAVIEHRQLYGNENNVTNHSNSFCLGTTGCYGNEKVVSVAGKEMDGCIQAGSDSVYSSKNEIADTHLSVTRETSPISQLSPPDYQTPERIPLSSRNNFKLISKPLFQFNDNENFVSSNAVDRLVHIETGKLDSSAKCEHVSNDVAIPTKVDIGNHGDLVTRPIQNMPYSAGIIGEKSLLVYNDSNLHSEIRRDSFDSTDNFEVTEYKITENKNVNSVPMVSLLCQFNAEQSNSTNAKGKRTSVCDRIELAQSEVTVPNQEVNVQNREVNVQNKTLSVQSSLKISANNAGIRGSVDMVSKLECKICGLKFPSQSQLIHHSKEHRDIIRCWKCGEEFPSAERLNMHMKLKHKGQNPYKCETCSREFTQYNNLRRHQRVHRENMYKCNLCDREFNEEFYLKMHMGTHTGNRVYSCGVCRSEFPSNYDLKIHVKTHSPSLLHTCHVCGKSFSKACVLRQHKKCHSGQRPHKCAVCEKTFIHRHHLTMHMKSHSDDERRAADMPKVEDVPGENNNTFVDVNGTIETDASSSKEMNKENIKPGKRSTASSECFQKPHITCNKNLSEKFLKISENQNLNVNEAVRNKKRRGRKNSAGPMSDLSRSNVDRNVPPSCPKSEAVSVGYMPNTSYSYQPLQNHLHPGMMPPLFSGSLNQYEALYKRYSQQVQAYMNNMYMMNYLSQNAMLQSFQGHLGLQGEGHKHFQGHIQLPAGKNPQGQDQCYSRMKGQVSHSQGHVSPSQVSQSPGQVSQSPGYVSQGQVSQSQGQVSQCQGQQSSGEDHQLIGRSQLDSKKSLEASSINEINVDNEAGKCKDVTQHDATYEEVSATTCLEVVSKNEELEVYVMKGTQEDAYKRCDKDSSDAMFISKSDEHEIAEEMIKMSTGVNYRPRTVDDNVVRNNVKSKKAVDIVKASEHFVSEIDESLDKTSTKDSSLNTKNKDKLNITCETIKNKCEHSDQGSKKPEKEFKVFSGIESSFEELENGIEAFTDTNFDYPPTLIQKLKTFISSEETHVDVTKDARSIKSTVAYSNNHSKNGDTCLSYLPWKQGKYSSHACSLDSEPDTDSVVGKNQRGIDVDEKCVENSLFTLKKNGDIQQSLSEVHDVEAFEDKENVVSACITEDHDKVKIDKLTKKETAGRSVDRESHADKIEIIDELTVDSNKELDKCNNFTDIPNQELEPKKLETDREVVEIVKDTVHPKSNLIETAEFEEEKDNPRSKLLSNGCSMIKGVETIDRLNIVDNKKEEPDHAIEHFSHGRFDTMEHTSDDNEAIDLRIKRRCDEEDFTPTCGGVATRDKNICVPLDFKAPKKSQSPRDLYVIKRSDMLNHGKFGQMTHYECSQSYLLEAGEFQYQLEDEISDVEPKLENSVKEQKKCARNRNKSSPARCALKQMDLNSPPNDRMHWGKSNATISPRLYKCEVCSRSFAQKHNLNRHKMSHNMKTYECKVCGRCFKEQFYLQMHMKVHNEDTKRLCEVCGQNVLKSEFFEHTNEHFHYIVENPTYSQIGDRVREILHVQKSSRESVKNDSVLYDQITMFPNMKGTLDELAQLMRLSKSSHIKGVNPP